MRDLMEIMADMRNQCISGIASIRLVGKGKYTEPQAFIKVLRNFNQIIELVVEVEKDEALRKTS